MSQPIVSEMYTQQTLSSDSPSTTRNTHQRPRLHGPPNPTGSQPTSSTSTTVEANTYKLPARLTPPSASTLSAPAIARKHVKSQSTSHVNSKSSSPTTEANSFETPQSSGKINNDILSGNIPDVHNGPSPPMPSMPASEIAVSSQPPPFTLPVTTTASEEPSLPIREQQQQQDEQPLLTATSSMATPSNQIPTIAQRDALTSRVYSVCQTAGYLNWLHLLDLSPLASQHHLSGYNCMKFGKQGSPYAYFPLSLQQPWQADAVTEKQRINESEAMKWLNQKRKRKAKLQEADRGVKRGGGVLENDGSRGRDIVGDGKGGIQTVANITVASRSGTASSSGDSEMRDASPARVVPLPSNDDEVKVNGPLSVETAVSQEYEVELKYDGKDSREASGCPSTVESEADTISNPQPIGAPAIKTSDSHPISISPMIPPELLIDITHYVQQGLPDTVRSEVKKESSHEDIVTPVHISMQMEDKRLIRCLTTRVDLCEVAQQAEQEMVDAAQSRRRPRLLTLQECPQNGTLAYLKTACTSLETSEDGDSELIPLAFGGLYRGFTIGNLLLSSCPGKKVRLTGPVRGRGAICRNLGLDLKRIKQLGVGALVCCLDDEELNFLGAPWSLYEQEADQLGMEVVRLPMAEGFCPTDVAMTDNAITSIVEQYTLRGVNVLVHCRGGVGRAGLIACIWMLKLGLVRSDHDERVFQNLIRQQQQQHTTNQFPYNNIDNDLDEVSQQRETMQVCQRLIDTIRRRRSPKAIETAEQVAFLFKYVTFLREQETKRRLSASPSSASSSSSSR